MLSDLSKAIQTERGGWTQDLDPSLADSRPTSLRESLWVKKCVVCLPCWVFLFFFFFLLEFFFLFCLWIFEFYFIYFLYSRFLLVIYFIHISVYMSIPISQFITPPPLPATFPPWCPYVCSLVVCHVEESHTFSLWGKALQKEKPRAILKAAALSRWRIWGSEREHNSPKFVQLRGQWWARNPALLHDCGD